MQQDDARRVLASYLTGLRVARDELERACDTVASDPDHVGYLRQELGLDGDWVTECDLVRARLAELAEMTAEEGEREMPELLAHIGLCSSCCEALWNLRPMWTEEERPGDVGGRRRRLADGLRVAMDDAGALRQLGLGPPPVEYEAVAAAMSAAPLAGPPTAARREWVLSDAEAGCAIHVVLHGGQAGGAAARCQIAAEPPEALDPLRSRVEVRDTRRGTVLFAGRLRDFNAAAPMLAEGLWTLRIAAPPGDVSRAWDIPVHIAREKPMADQDLLLDLYVQNHALPPCCGTRRRDGGIVWRWPEPKEVEEALLPAFALAGDHQPLSEAECKSVGWLFAFPNLVHWLLHMHAPKAGTPHVDGCPMPTPADGCDEVHGPEHVVVRDGHDFCRQRFHKHPWALQVSLLWSGEQRRRAPTRDQDKPPSRACAWAVYLGILDNPRVRQRWTQLGPNPRPEPVRQRWDLLVQGIENVVATAPTGDAPGFCRALAKGLLPRFLVGLCMVVNNAADLVRRRQRNLPNELKERIEQVVRALAVPFLLHYKAKWALRTERYLQQVDGLRKLLSELDAPGTDKVLAILGAGRLNRVLQRVVIEYLRDVVLPYRAQGLPGGDPMSDPVVADVFWDWVGGAKRPDSDRRFRPEEWGKRRWRSIGQGEGVPRWRTLE